MIIYTLRYDICFKYLCTYNYCTYIVHPVVPKITMPPLTQMVEASTNISFICVANAKPPATIKWMKNEIVLSNTTTIIISSTTMGSCTITDPPDQCVTSSTLRIFDTQPSDSGVYTCNATNEAGYVEKTATLFVNGTVYTSICCY